MYEGAAGEVHPFLEPEQAGTSPRQRRAGAGVEGLAVANGDVQAGSWATGDADLACRAAGVFADVGQCFLDDAIRVASQRIRHGIFVFDPHLEVDLRPGQPGLIDQPADVGQGRLRSWWRRASGRDRGAVR